MHLPHDHGHRSEAVRAEIPRPEAIGPVCEIMKLVSDSKRLELFWLLCHCEECVINLSALLKLSSPAVSHHLKLLKNAGLVISRREGREVYYTAAETPRTQILHDMTEALLEMACPVQSRFEESKRYHSQIGTIHQIHTLLTSDLTRRYTIDMLCARFHINPTTLKTEFKRVFGQPIAAYMKHYRILKSQELLRNTDLPIGQIARQTGYVNPSKFTQAFREVTGVLPKDYRKEK